MCYICILLVIWKNHGTWHSFGLPSSPIRLLVAVKYLPDSDWVSSFLTAHQHILEPDDAIRLGSPEPQLRQHHWPERSGVQVTTENDGDVWMVNRGTDPDDAISLDNPKTLAGMVLGWPVVPVATLAPPPVDLEHHWAVLYAVSSPRRPPCVTTSSLCFTEPTGQAASHVQYNGCKSSWASIWNDYSSRTVFLYCMSSHTRPLYTR